MKPCNHIFLVAFLFFHLQSSAQKWDVELAESINKNQTAFKNTLSSSVANSITPVTIAVPLTLLTTGLITHDKKYLQDALYVSGAYILSGTVTAVLKKTFKERRPFDKYPEEVVKRNGTAGGPGFPSGHTSAAFNLATSLALRYRKPIVIIPAFLYAGTMGWARIYQGVHYPTDVLAGAFVGAGTAWVSYKLQKVINRKKSK